MVYKMNKYNSLSIKDRENTNFTLCRIYKDNLIQSHNYKSDINKYISLLSNTNRFNIQGVLTRSKNINVVINVNFYKEISLPSDVNNYVTHLPDNILAIIFDDDIIAKYDNRISLSPFYSCVILTNKI